MNHEASAKYFHPLPSAISITNCSEAGTNYTPEDVAAIGAVARKHGLVLHMDGARFANAVAAVGCSPAEVTWMAGVDVLSLGFTKNGAMAAEAVVFFNHELITDFRYRYKRSGHLWCKMRFLSSQIEGMLANDVWMKNARHANGLAKRLEAGFTAAGLTVLPVHANEVFLSVDAPLIQVLRKKGHHFLDYAQVGTPTRRLRLVTSWSSTADECDSIISDATTAHTAFQKAKL